MSEPRGSLRVQRALLLAAALLGMALTARLGFWQLDRAAQKLALHESVERRQALPALPAAELAGDEAGAHEQLSRRVQLRGRWLSERTVFLDNRPLKPGQGVGFIVVTPLQLEGRDAAVLVQRGWAPRDAADRQRLPQLHDPNGPVQISGRLIAAPSRVMQLGESGEGAIRQNLEPAAYARETGLRLLPATVLQLASTEQEGRPADDALLRDWPAPDLGLQKHYGYAFQWFALCALILILYVWFQIVRPRRRA